MDRIHTDDFTVGWVTAIPVEQAAAEQILDEEYDRDRLHPPSIGRFTLGRIGRHKVVIGSPPAGAYGPGAAAAVATRLQFVFKRLQVRLLVGIAGGVPVNPDDDNSADVRLGDVVVSQPSRGCGGVIAYDLGKEGTGGRIERTGFLNAPPNILLDAVSALKVRIFRQTSATWSHLSAFDSLADYTRETAGDDILFSAESEHVAGPTCERCAPTFVDRPPRRTTQPMVHYGTIASGSLVIKNAKSRDIRNRELGGNVLCFEMEAAGVILNDFPCLVIRGISDYADSHKNDLWQPYASATAAAYAKELLLAITPGQPEPEPVWTQKCIIKPHRRLSFVRRNAVLANIDAQLKPSQTHHHRRIALAGLAGAGKSELALEYAYQAHADGRSVFWIDATDFGSFEQGCNEITVQVLPGNPDNQTRNAIARFLRWLTDAVSGSWLLVMDNVGVSWFDDESVTDTLPINPKGSILFTTRTYELAIRVTSGYGSAISVGPMSQSEAVKLLRTGITVAEDEDSEAKTLVHALDYLPIGIVQATAYMSRELVSIRRYYQLLEQSDDDRARLLGYTYQAPQEQTSLLRVWCSTFENIRTNNSAAFSLLGRSAMCSPKDIPSFLLQFGWDEQDFEKASQSLVNLGMLSKTGLMFTMYRTVHFALRRWLEERHSIGGLATAAIRLMASVMPDGTYHTWQRCNELLPHTVVVLQSVGDSDIVDTLTVSRSMGFYLMERGNYEQSEAMLKTAFEGGCRLLGVEHDKTLDVMSALAATKSRQGERANAIELQTKHQDIRRRVHAWDYHKILLGTQNLAEIYMEGDTKDDSNKASEILKPLSEECQRIFGQDDPRTLNSTSTYARCLLHIGRLQEADTLLRETGEKIHNLLGDDHPWLLSNVESFSMLLVLMDEYADAETMLDETATRSKRVLGEEHPVTLGRLGGLAKLYWINKKFANAETLLIKVIKSATEVLGDAHPTTIASLECLWRLYQKLERLDKAQEYGMKTVIARSKTNGEKHLITLKCYNELIDLMTERAKLMKKDERFDQLATTLILALKTEEGWETSSEGGKLHPDTLKTKVQLSLICNGMGRHQDAIDYMQQAICGFEAIPEARNSVAHRRCSQLLQDLQKRKKGQASSKSSCSPM